MTGSAGCVGDGSIRDQLQTLRSALTQAMRWGWMGQNPARLASDHRAKRTPRDVMEVEAVQRVLVEAKAVHEMASIAFRLAAITGARRAELAALKWTDLDGDQLTIDSALSVVRESTDDGHRSVLRDDPTKTADRRRVALDPETVHLLEAQRSIREQVTVWMFSDDEDPPSPDRTGYWWRRCRDFAQIDRRWRLHDLRHWVRDAVGRGVGGRSLRGSAACA